MVKQTLCVYDHVWLYSFTYNLLYFHEINAYAYNYLYFKYILNVFLERINFV